MMIKRLTLVLMLLILTGCTQNLKKTELSANEKIPSISYEAYFYVEGSGNKARAVLLILPDAKVNVEAESHQVTATTATYGEALSYMNQVKDMRRVNTEALQYKDRPLGYLLTYSADITPTTLIGTQIIIQLYERNNTIFFIPRLEFDHSY
jgi:hypothetical protein